MATQPLLIRIQGDPSAFKSAMDEVRTAVDRTGASIQTISAKTQTLGESLGRLGSTLTLGVTAPIVGMATAAVKAAVDLDALQRGLSATMKSSTAAADEMKKLRDVAKLPGIGMEDAVRGSIRLQTLGVSADKAREIMTEFGNALSIVGGSRADFSEVIRQMSQLAATGKVTKENLDPIIERIPQVAAIIREKFGPQALGDPAKVFEKLGIDSQRLIQILTTEMKKLERSTGGPKAALDVLGDTIKESAARIGMELLPHVTEAIPKLEAMAKSAADAVVEFKKLPEPIKDTALAIAGLMLAAGPIMKVASGVMALSGSIRAAGAAIAASGIGRAAAGLSGAAAGGAAAGGAAVYLLGDAMMHTSTAMENQKRAADAAADSMKRLNDRFFEGQKPNAAPGFALTMDTLVSHMKTLAPEAAKASDNVGKVATSIRVTNVAMRDANGELDKHSLAYVELQERVKSGLGRAKDAILDYVRSGTVFGKTLETHRSQFDENSTAALNFSAHLAAVRRELESMPEAKLVEVNTGGMRNASVFGTDDLLGSVGARSTRQLQAELERRERVLADIKRRNAEGKATGNDVIAAEQAVRQAEGALNGATGAAKKTSAAMQQVSTIMTDLSRAVARNIIEWKSWGEMIKGVAKNAAEAIIRTLVEGALTKLTTKLLNVGGLMGRIFGTGGGSGLDIRNIPSPGGMTPLPTGGAPAPAAAGASAGSGIMGAVNMVSGIATAISSVVGNFQMMGMNKSLDLIEKEVRYSQIHLLHLLNKANEFWPNSKNIWESLLRMEQRQMSVAGGTSMVFNFEAGSLGAGVSQSQVEAAFRTAVEKFKRQGIN